MPIFKQSETKDVYGGVPETQVENLSTKPVVAAKPEKSFIDKVVDVGSAAALEHNWASQLVNEESNPYQGQKPNAAYNPFEDEQIKHHNGPLDWFTTSNSKEETAWRVQQYARKQERQKTLEEAGGWGTAASLAAGLFTPDILIGGGILSKTVKAGQYAKAAAVGAETGFISGGLYGVGQNQIDSSRTGLDVVKDAGAFAVAGAVIGPVLHGAGQLITRGGKAKTNVPPVVDDHIPGPADIDAAASAAKAYGQHMAADVPVDMEAQAAKLTADLETRKTIGASITAAEEKIASIKESIAYIEDGSTVGIDAILARARERQGLPVLSVEERLAAKKKELLDAMSEHMKLTDDLTAHLDAHTADSMDEMGALYHSMPEGAEKEALYKRMLAVARKDPYHKDLNEEEILTELNDWLTSVGGNSASAQARVAGQAAPVPPTGHVPPKWNPPYTAPTVANTDLVGSFGANKINLNQASVTLANSSFTEFKLAAQKLFRDLRMRVGNTDGSWTNLQSVESEFERLAHGAIGKGHDDFNKAFREYNKSGWETPQTLAYVQQKYGKNKLTMTEFDDEIGHAMSNGDRHAIREVQGVAQSGRTITEAMADEARRLGLLDTTGQLKGANSYFGRNYNKEKIIAQQSAFRRMLANEFQRTNPTWTAKQLDDAAMNVYEQIIRGGNDRLTNIKSIHIDTNGNIIPLGKGSKSAVAMERKLDIDDNVLEPYLNKSYRDFVTRYSNTVGTDVALMRMLGDTDGTAILERALAEKQSKALAIEANTTMTALQKEAAMTKLEAEFEKGQRAINNGINIIRGEYKLDTTMPKSWTTTAHALTTYSYITKMGGAALSSIGDFTKSALYFGFGKSMSYALPALRQGLGDIFRLPAVKDPAFDAMVQANKRLGVGMEIVLHTRHAQINDLVEKYTGTNPVVRGLDYLAGKMGVMNGLAHLTDFQKQLVGVISNDEIIRSTIAEVAGSASERELRNLRVWGITPEMSQRIATEFHSGVAAGHNLIDRGFHVTDTLKWADKEAADTLERALTAMNNTIVYTPSAGAKVVTGLDKATESVLTQFMSFNFGSHIQHFTQFMQQIHERDSSAMGYFVASLMVGATVYELKDTVRNMGKDGKLFGERKERTTKEIIYDTLDQSSLAPAFYMFNSVASGVSRQLDAKSWMGVSDKTPSLSAANFNAGSLFGPSGQLVADGFKVASDYANDTVDARTTSAERRLTPFNSLFWLRGGFNYAEERINDGFDLPDRATSTFTIRKN